MASQAGLFLQCLINNAIKEHCEATCLEAGPSQSQPAEEGDAPSASCVVQKLFALTAKGLRMEAGPLVNAKDVIHRLIRRKLTPATDEPGDSEPPPPEVNKVEAERLRKLNQDLAAWSRSQLERVNDSKTARKLCRVFGLPMECFRDWERGQQRRQAQRGAHKSPSPRKAASRKRKSPEPAAAPRQVGRSRFAAEAAGLGPDAAAAAAAVAGGPQLAPKRLFAAEAAVPAAAAGPAGKAGAGSEQGGSSMEVDNPAAQPPQPAAAPAAGSVQQGGPPRLPSVPAGRSKPRKPVAPKASAAGAGGLAPWKTFLGYLQDPQPATTPQLPSVAAQAAPAAERSLAGAAAPPPPPPPPARGAAGSSGNECWAGRSPFAAPEQPVEQPAGPSEQETDEALGALLLALEQASSPASSAVLPRLGSPPTVPQHRTQHGLAPAAAAAPGPPPGACWPHQSAPGGPRAPAAAAPPAAPAGDVEMAEAAEGPGGSPGVPRRSGINPLGRGYGRANSRDVDSDTLSLDVAGKAVVVSAAALQRHAARATAAALEGLTLHRRAAALARPIVLHFPISGRAY